MKKNKKPPLFIFYPMSVQTKLKHYDLLAEENRELIHILNQPLNKHLKLCRHYKSQAAEAREEIQELKQNQFTIQKDNHELMNKITEMRETNDELKKRQDAYRNSIEHLLELLDEKDRQLEQKDIFIQQLVEDSIIQSNHDRYFDFM